MSGEIPTKISSIADSLWQLSVGELEQIGGVVEKILAAKREVSVAEERSTEAGEHAAAQSLAEFRKILESPQLEMSGPEAVMAGSYYMHEEGHEWLDSKRLNIFLDSYGRKPANSTSIVDKLESRGLMEVDADGPHAHKKFRLTKKGSLEAVDLYGELRRRRRDGGLAVVNR
jgi:hypothetical protein